MHERMIRSARCSHNAITTLLPLEHVGHGDLARVLGSLRNESFNERLVQDPGPPDIKDRRLKPWMPGIFQYS